MKCGRAHNARTDIRFVRVRGNRECGDAEREGMSMITGAILDRPLLGGILWGSDGLLARVGSVMCAEDASSEGLAGPNEMIDSPYGCVPSYIRQQPTFKFVALAARRSDLTAAKFHTHWLSVHGPLLRTFMAALRMQRYVQSHVVDSRTIDGFSTGRNWTANPYDGVVEAWFESEADFAAGLASPEGQKASAVLAEDERRFCDPRTTVFATCEYEVYRTPPHHWVDPGVKAKI